MNNSLSSTGLSWIWISLIIIIVDFSIKLMVMKNFTLEVAVPLFPHANLYYIQNYGAAFSFLSDKNGWQRWFFSSISIIICIILFKMMSQTKTCQRLINISYALIIGGALGNLIDRLRYGFVIDMIDFYIGHWHFPVFNFADSAICAGAFLFILENLLSNRSLKNRIDI